MLNLTPPIYGALNRGTKKILLVCGGVFLLEFFMRNFIVFYFGLVPYKVVNSGWVWQIFTYLFIHGGFWHFFFNMLMLWIFGQVVEGVMGEREFLKYFFITGAGAGIITVLFSFNSPVPVVGASGAIYGLMIAFAVFFPDAKVYLYFLIPVSSRQMVAVLAAFELAMSFSGANPHIANVAHLGGMLVGYLYLKRPRLSTFPLPSFFRKREIDPSERIDYILDKISRRGIESLSESEREFLDRYSGRS